MLELLIGFDPPGDGRPSSGARTRKPPTLLLAALMSVCATTAPQAALEAGPAAAGDALFADRAAEVGLTFHHFDGASGELYYAEMMGPGGALFDYDGDGDLDAYLLQGQMMGPGKTIADALTPPRHPLPLTDRLYRNDLQVGPDGSPRLRFTDVTGEAGLAPGDYSYGVAAGDYDNDGWVDLYVAAFGANRLLRNRGDGTFQDVTEASGTGDPRWSVTAIFFDYDRDGWLDLYVVNYVDFHTGKHKFCPDPTGARDYCGPSAYEPVSDRLFRNRGDGTFQDVSVESGVVARAGAGLGVVAADLTGDRRPDLYVANDGSPNFLLVNQGDGTFRDEALLAGCAVNAEGAAEASMGVAVGDVDGDGYLDLFLTHLNNETNTLYSGGEGGLFREGTEVSGLGTPSWPYTGFGTGFVDLERDGLLDLVVVNGAVTLFAGRGGLAQPNQLFRNLGGGRFQEISEEAGPAFALAEVSRGAAFGDVDDDGDTDLLVVNAGGPARLLLNEAQAAGGWLGLRLVTGDPPRDALGATAVLRRSGRPSLLRLATAGGSYASSGDPRVLFGLGDDGAKGFTVEVTWPGGRRGTFTALAPGQYHTLREGSGQSEEAGQPAGNRSTPDPSPPASGPRAPAGPSG